MPRASTDVHASMVDVLDENDSLIYLDEDVVEIEKDVVVSSQVSMPESSRAKPVVDSLEKLPLPLSPIAEVHLGENDGMPPPRREP